MTYLRINGIEYEATFDGRVQDYEWDNRESKTIHVEMDYDFAKNLLVDDVQWYIVSRTEVPIYDPETGLPTGETEERVEVYDNSDYSFAGDIIDHRNGKLSCKMGKETPLEEAYEIIYG